MTEIPPVPSHLDQDILCIGCGYNLRGLEPSGRCPECGLAVADSIRGDRLVFADPTWLGKLRFGASLKLWNILITILISFIAGFLVAAMGAPYQIVWVISAIGAALGLWATFCITSQEPRISLTEDPVTLRKVIRTCALIACVGSIVQHLGNTALTSGAFSALSGAVVFWMMLTFITAVAGLVVMVGELKYFRRFALRAPDLKLARSTRIVMWGLAISYGLTSLGSVLLTTILAPAMGVLTATGPATTTMTTAGIGYTATVTTTVTTTPTGAATPPSAGATSAGPATASPPVAMPGFATVFYGVGACIFGLAVVIFSIWYVSLLSRYRKLFQTALLHAKCNA